VLTPAEGKNQHAQALSALGSAKGGEARAESLTAKKRSAIAKKAVTPAMQSDVSDHIWTSQEICNLDSK
jgi:hypothetical protein